MKRLVIILYCIVAIAMPAQAQEQASLRQKADALFERYEYAKCVPLYLKLAQKAKPNVQVVERLALCYVKMSAFEQARDWYAQAVENLQASAQSHYQYAQLLLYFNDWDTAKQQFEYYYGKTGDAAALKLKLAGIDLAKAWMAQKPAYTIKNMGGLNTEYADWGLNYEGTSGLLFISDRPTESPAQYPWTGNGYLKLYSANLKGDPGDLLDLKMPDTLNTDYHIGPMITNAIGDTAYITITTGLPKHKIATDTAKASKQRLYTRRLKLLMAIKKDGHWGNLSNFAYNNIAQYSVGQAALSLDGELLYFTSDMPGGYGKTDIWYCQKQANGSWGKPINCGPAINTADEEAFASIGGDGKLYYASKGLPGMGGFDIFVATGQKAAWGMPQNLQYPINSGGDDFCLVTKDGTTGYLSSNRQGGVGNDDIYSFVLSNPLPVLATQPVVVAQHTDTPVITAPAPKVAADVRYQDFIVYYDLDKANIRPDAALILDSLATILTHNPALKIQLASHTDSRASGAYNIQLSARRAASVMEYLFNKGIGKGRMTAQWFGKKHLVNHCADGVTCTEAEHQLNRRTEIHIVLAK